MMSRVLIFRGCSGNRIEICNRISSFIMCFIRLKSLRNFYVHAECKNVVILVGFIDMSNEVNEPLYKRSLLDVILIQNW